MNRIILGVSLGLALGFFTSPLGAKEPEGKTKGAIYAPAFAPPARPAAFLPLPPGAVEPQGWLGDWCLTARDGATGHLDEIDRTGKCKRLFDRHGRPRQARLPDMADPRPDGLLSASIRRKMEVVPYWLDGMVRLGYVMHDDFLQAKARSRLDVVADKTDKDSLLFMWWLNRHDPQLIKQLGPWQSGCSTSRLTTSTTPCNTVRR